MSNNNESINREVTKEVGTGQPNENRKQVGNASGDPNRRVVFSWSAGTSFCVEVDTDGVYWFRAGDGVGVREWAMSADTVALFAKGVDEAAWAVAMDLQERTGGE